MQPSSHHLPGYRLKRFPCRHRRLKMGLLYLAFWRNKQEVRLFVFTEDGVNEYLPHGHELKKVADGDHRDLVAARQDFVKSAPVSLVLVMDMDKFGGTEPRQISMATVDAGIVCENISVAAAGLGLAARPRGSMNSDAIKELLGLNVNQIPIMNNVIGYPLGK